MKKKSFAVFLMLLMLFAAAGSIYHEGIKSHVSASQVDHPKREFAKKEVESTFAFQHQTMVMDEVTEESPNVNIATPQPNNDNSNRDIVQNTTLPSSKDVHIESEVPADNQEATDPANPEDESLDEKQSEDFIMIDNQKYYNIMHEEKFSHWINIAQKYGAILYAIPYSDGFAIVKDGERIVSMSTGAAAAKPSNADVLSDLFANHGEYAAGIAEGIKHVVQTGETIEVVVTPETTGYAISKRDEWIVVSW